MIFEKYSNLISNQVSSSKCHEPVCKTYVSTPKCIAGALEVKQRKALFFVICNPKMKGPELVHSTEALPVKKDIIFDWK